MRSQNRPAIFLLGPDIIKLSCIIQVIFIPYLVRLYVEIIREWIILRSGGQTWYNYFIPPTTV